MSVPLDTDSSMSTQLGDLRRRFLNCNKHWLVQNATLSLNT